VELSHLLSTELLHTREAPKERYSFSVKKVGSKEGELVQRQVASSLQRDEVMIKNKARIFSQPNILQTKYGSWNKFQPSGGSSRANIIFEFENLSARHRGSQ
jgi:hypothetical protein